MISFLAFAAILASQADDEAIRERLRALVGQLDAERLEEREAAFLELGKSPVRFAPFIAERGSTLGPQASAYLTKLAVPAPWPEFLDGAIKDAPGIIERLRKREGGRHSGVAADTLNRLAVRTPTDVQRILGVLWASADPGLRELALDGWVRWPPADLGIVRSLLAEPWAAERPAEILVLAGDMDSVPVALAAYESRRPNSHRAALPVLARLGVPDEDLDRIEKAWPDGFAPDRLDFWILGRRGTEKGAKLLAEWIKSSKPGAAAAIPVLAWIGGESHMEVVRDWAAANVAEKYVPWPLHDPAAALRRFETLGDDSTSQDFIDKLSQAWHAGPALRGPVLVGLAKPGVKLNHRRLLLRMLGGAGRVEDATVLLESLGDPRLADAAAEALDRMGDPAHAGALFDAFMRYDASRSLGPAVLSLPSDGLEDRIVEVLGDADSYQRQAGVAVILAGRNLTPRLRDALLKAYERSPGLLEGPVERVLLDPGRSNDADLARILRASANSRLVAMGTHLALRTGDAEGAVPAAWVAMSRGQGSRPELGRPWLDWSRSETWIAALTEVWMKERGKPGVSWPVTAWLAERGHAAALDDIRARLAGPPSSTTAFDAIAIATGGDSKDRDLAIQMFLDPRRQLDRAANPPPRLNAKVGALLDAAQRTKIIDLARKETPHSPTGMPLRRALLLAAHLELPEGRPLYRYIVSLTEGEQTSSTSIEQVACIQALVALKDKSALAEIRLQVRSLSPTVRVAAMDALAALGDREACARIVRYVDDDTELPSQNTYEWGPYTQRPTRRVWHHAMEALEKLTGKTPEAKSIVARREFWRAWAADAGK